MREAINAWFEPYLPDYDSRLQQPGWHLPLLIATCFGTCIFQLDHRLRLYYVFPVVVFMTAIRIVCTTGSVTGDFSNALIFLLMTLSFADHLVIEPAREREARLLNSPKGPRSGPSAAVQRFKHIGAKGVALEDCTSVKERVYWAASLFTTWRGIGWNWQVRKIPSNPDIGLTNRQAAIQHLLRAAKYFVRKTAALYLINFANTLRIRNSGLENEDRIYTVLIETIFVWATQIRMFDSFKSLYSSAAAVTIFLGICLPAEWPPLTGKLGNAWSVRQVWGQVWHQLFRRTFELYSGLLVSALGLRKGSFASRYTKLYASFAISALIHLWLCFCAAPDEMGHFSFFMSQAVVITLEDFVRFVWRETGGRKQSDPITRFEKLVGYVWTFVWFTYSSREMMQAFVERGMVVPDKLLEPSVWDLGRIHALLFLQQ